MIVIDATHLLVGRIATYVSKKVLHGEEVSIVNSEKAIISGPRKRLVERYKEKVERGHPYKGPFYPVREDLILKRAIRGMLPWKNARGKEAFKRLRCYIGVPAELHGKKFETLERANADKLPNYRYLNLEQLSVELRGKQ